MTPAYLDALLVVARARGVKGATISQGGPHPWSLEFVFESLPPPPKEKPEDDATPEGGMPTRAQIEADRQRIEKGGLK